MAEKGERRSPTSHRTPTQMRRKARSKTQNASPENKKKRAANNAARAKLMKEGKVKKGDGKHVDHKKPLAKGGTNKRSNLRVQSAKKNTSHGMANQHTKKKRKKR